MVDQGQGEVLKDTLSRADFLKLGALGAGAFFLASCGRAPEDVVGTEIGQSNEIKELEEGCKIPLTIEGLGEQVFATVLYREVENIPGKAEQVNPLFARFKESESGDKMMVCQPIDSENPPERRMVGEILSPKISVVSGNPEFEVEEFGLYSTPGLIQWGMGEDSKPVGRIESRLMQDRYYALPVSAVAYDYMEGKGYRPSGNEGEGRDSINEGWALVNLVSTESSGLVMMVEGYVHDGRVLMPQKVVGVEDLALGA